MARAFAVTEGTIASWLKRVDEEGERALLQMTEPVNKFPQYVGYLVRLLKSMCPAMGKESRWTTTPLQEPPDLVKP